MTELKELRKKCLAQAKKAVGESVNEDDYIIQTIRNIEELAEKGNSLASRVKDWYSLYFPEAVRNIKDNESFIHQVSRKGKEELMEELELDESMGADFQEKDVLPLLEYVDTVKQIYELKEELENYLEQVMSTHCWNLQQVAGSKVGAKLLQEAGGLKKLAMKPSTSIQVLGAEKAMFRHLKQGGKPPKHGHIFLHPLVQGADEDNRGKVARVLADKIALCARADYFGEKYIGEDMRKELEEKYDGA